METSEALRQLAAEIRELRNSFHGRKSSLEWVREAWHPGSRLSVFRLTSAIFCFILFLALLSAQTTETVISAIIVFLLTLLNLCVSGLDSYLRKEEIFRRTDRAVKDLEREAGDRGWREENYPHLHTPLSASIVLQWVLRDKKVVNLPWALLVKGDTVLLKPGQVAPARCRLLNQWISLKLEQGETFHMDSVQRVEKSLLPEFRPAAEPEKFVLEETPFLSELELVFREAQIRPVSKLNKQRYYLITILEHILLPALVSGVLGWNCFRHKYSWSWLPGSDLATLFLLEPATVAIPLLPLVFPVWWIITNHAALANVLSHFRFSTVEVTSDPFDDTIESPDIEERGTDATWRHLWTTFYSCLTGDGSHVSRTENLLHTLGSVTTYCCLDKKGVLSWQNPSAEKIFFFKKNKSSQNSGLVNLLNKKPPGETAGAAASDVISEIMTVTHDHTNPFRVEFDDPMWRTNVSSLKPLGLSMLLNTCNLWTEEKYTHFFHHLLCESIREPLQGDVKDTNTLDLLPIPARGCLCELSSRIGFQPGAENDYELKQQMQTFRPVVSDSPGGDTFTRNLALAKLKFPFPHMVSLVVENKVDRNLQLVTQGTADIVIDSCVDAWVGSDLTSLSEDLRKKILEFYHRASLTSYCSAFSYRPLSYIPPWPETNHYLELPPNSSPFISQYHQVSADSIDRVSLGPTTIGGADEPPCKEFEHESQNVYACLEAQCNQTFLGMVQMQYQARVDIVQFIDLLEKACIRFVHFSKENELRSRVFSEKMGLESGWNCHISLRSEGDLRQKTRQMYSRKWVTKKFSTESEHVKRFVSTSVPEKLDGLSRVLEFPRWADIVRPAVMRGGSGSSENNSEEDERTIRGQGGLAEEDDGVMSGSASTDSMLQYDMSNRAQLPCGIENIRPHLDKMDNVPLLVSLFTDCTPESMREMVKIMQENGEVVATLGSSANYHNIKIFAAADASLSVEPLYPQVCQQVPVYSQPATGLSPIDLASHLTSLSSSVQFKRDDKVSIYNCIMASRRHVLALRHSLQFWTATCLFLSVTVILCILLSLPSPLSAPQQLFLNVVHLPLIAVALLFSSADRNIRNISTGKNGNVMASREMVWYATWCYAFRFCLPLVSLITSHFLAIIELASHSSESCSSQLSAVEDVNMTFLTVYIVLISLSFVSRTDHLWNLKPRKSWPILLVGAGVILAQAIYLAVSLAVRGARVSVFTWAVYSVLTPVVVVANELIKRQEIKVNVRFQKRARLEFGTKLGINSPF